MFALAKPALGKERFVSFPIAKNRVSFYQAVRNKKRPPTPGLPRGALTVLERMQPYHTRVFGRGKILWQLKRLDQRDKLRTLPTSLLVPGNTSIALIDRTC